MLSIDPQNTRVVLIGTSKFIKESGLDPLPGVEGNIRDLTEVFSKPDIVGIPRQNIKSLLNWKSSSEVAKRLAQIAREAKDTLIVYYSGHGQIGGSPPQLYLAVSGTTTADLQFDALSIRWVKTAISQSGAQKKILILDCCYSGRALGTMTAQSQMVKAGIDIKGTYSLAASPANEEAIAPPSEEHTAFTGELIRVLREGIDNKKEGINLKDIFLHIRDEFRGRPGLPEPQQSNVQDGEDLIIARNKKFVQSKVEGSLPPLIKEALASTNSNERCKAVIKLNNILQGNDVTLAKSARKQLERLSSEDPNSTIQTMANTFLEIYITTTRTEKPTITTSTSDVEIAKEKAGKERLEHIVKEIAAKEKTEKERLEREAKEKAGRGHLAGDLKQNLIDMLNSSFTTYQLHTKFNPSGDYETDLGTNPGKTIADTRGMDAKEILNKFNNDELKQACARHGLPTLGKKDVLVYRLLEVFNLGQD